MNPMMTALLSVLLLACGVALIRASSLFATMAMLAAYSGLVLVLLGLLGAPDVAFTEAVVGAGVSTVVFMAIVRRVDPNALARRAPLSRAAALSVSLAFGAALLLGVSALPAWGEGMCRASPIYIRKSLEDAATPNVVTAILADYRGFDTLIEATVTFSAALVCALVLRRRP